MKTVREAMYVVATIAITLAVITASLNEYQYGNEQQTVANHLKQFDGTVTLSDLKRDHNRSMTMIHIGQLLATTMIGAYITYKAGCFLRHRNKLRASASAFTSGASGNCCGPHHVGCGQRVAKMATTASLLFMSTALLSGCYSPYEPNQLEIIQSNEYAFLLPFTDDVGKQVKTDNEEFLKKKLVFAKQVRIPQQWVATDYAWFYRTKLNGSWKPAALLLKVENSPVTREWTADTASGSSNKNEAIWVMTADQVEFSTGWSCTARIASEDDAVKFLHNYRNGELKDVLDKELRMKLATEFALEITDIPMDKLRKDATPHITATVKRVTEFFEQRGISVTNLGITGGFVYKDPTIQATLVKAFNAEQGKNLAIAATQTQEEQNKQIQLEATGKAKARLTEAEAEADSIKLVADAKEYELQKAKDNIETYLALKRLEVEKDKVEKWDGRFPTTYFGEKSPNMLLNIDSK